MKSAVVTPESARPSAAARQRLLALPGEPLFYSEWRRVVFIHFDVDPAVLRREVPFALDLLDDRAFVSLVAFTLCRLQPRYGGRLTKWVFAPFATQKFLNVRTYVWHRGEPGIYFLAEWLSNRFSVLLGPRLFGLPYRFGKLSYDHEQGECRGRVGARAGAGTLNYRGWIEATSGFLPSEPGSIDEFLLERYTAFTRHAGRDRFFRIWHRPWPQTILNLTFLETGLLNSMWPWLADARMIGANYSPGVGKVWMGWPHGMR